MDHNNQPTELPTQEEFQSLVTQANDGDPAALRQLRQLLDNETHLASHFGNLFEHAKEALIGLIGESNVLLTESLRREAKSMERELAGDRPTLLETLVVRRIVLNWLQLQHVDATIPEPKGKSLAQKTAAERNWAQALRNLELVRTKLVPQTPVGKPKKQRRKRKVRQANGVPVNRVGHLVGCN